MIVEDVAVTGYAALFTHAHSILKCNACHWALEMPVRIEWEFMYYIQQWFCGHGISPWGWMMINIISVASSKHMDAISVLVHKSRTHNFARVSSTFHTDASPWDANGEGVALFHTHTALSTSEPRPCYAGCLRGTHTQNCHSHICHEYNTIQQNHSISHWGLEEWKM